MSARSRAHPWWGRRTLEERAPPIEQDVPLLMSGDEYAFSARKAADAFAKMNPLHNGRPPRPA